MDKMISIGMSVLMAVVISFVTFMSKRQKGEAFNTQKAIRTVIVGIVIGAIAGFSGVSITADNYQTYLTANMGAIAIIDQVLKIAWRFISPAKTA